MRLRNIAGSREVIADSEYAFTDDVETKGRWAEIFGNDHPIRIEIGMGKGRFIHTLAAMNPDINYVGIEKYSSVLLRAIQKMDEDPLPNLRFIRMDAENITEKFMEHEVDRIYLNFSDPWPKDRHAKRRLPSAEFLKRYDYILKPEGIIEFKTDNRDLFDFAVGELQGSKWEAQVIT
nr:tRNA (guanosine(46)-N7)-methyltransferase TrmB [Butyrivibrio sp.]